MFFHTKSVPEPRWSTSAVRRLRDSLVWSDHGRIMVGSVSDRFRIVNGVSTVFRPCAVDRISLWFATVGSFPQCKWDCKWCWWMSCRWSFEGRLARNAFLRDSRCTKPYVFPYKVRPRTSMIYLCGATVARRSRVWSDHSRIMFGSCSDRFRIVNGVSPVFRAFAVDIIPLWFVTVGSFPQCKWDCKWCWWMSCRWNSIVICNSRIVPSLQMGLQVVLVEELPMEFWRTSRTKCVFER